MAHPTPPCVTHPLQDKEQAAAAVKDAAGRMAAAEWEGRYRSKWPSFMAAFRLQQASW